MTSETLREQRTVDQPDVRVKPGADKVAADGSGSVPAVHGLPAVAGRWQPTRAGVLNSWKWTDEEFHFANGWLAFIGRNGSGKSLTASQLVTVLLDGDTSQTALSVSGRAAGTLMTRHTDNRDKDDKTGVWWLEYGRTDPATAQTEYMTSGLWLRSSGQSLLRAFFLVPGRVGEHLTLQVDRNAVGIDSLAKQLAVNGGEVFTDAQRLKPKAAAHLSAISPEAAYRTAVRTQLFAPLDEVQYDALLSVLRTLRSVRTAEKISARDMLDVLTGALPALEQGKLSEIATAMQRIATLETQLADTKEQSKKLAGTDRVYELYRRTVALATAAALRSANTDFDNLTRSERAAKKALSDADTVSEEARMAHEQATVEFSRLEGELRAADTALRDHAGAELPHHEQRARDLETAAEAAEDRAEQAETDATTARSFAREATQNAAAGQQSLATISDELTTTAGNVQGHSALTRLLAATRDLAHPGQLVPGAPTVEIRVDELAATPIAWVEMRQENVEKVTATLGEVNTANQIAIAAADQQRTAQNEVDVCSEALAECVASRVETERRVDAAITDWQKSTNYYPPVPEAILDPDPVEGRVNPARLKQWLDQQTAAIRQQLDVPGHRVRKEAADRAAKQAVSFAEEQQKAAADATGVVATLQAQHDEHVRQIRAAAEQAGETRRQAEHEHTRRVEAARKHQHDHVVVQLERAEATLEAVTAWADHIQRWRLRLQHLDGGALIPPDSLTKQAELLRSELSAARTEAQTTWLDQTDPAVRIAEDSLTLLADYDDGPLRKALAEAAKEAFGRLNRQVVEAENAVAEVRKQIGEVTTELEQARQAPAPPPAPAWRTRFDGHPLWSLVDFRENVPADARNRCEGALFVSGLLDAVVTADGRARAGDTILSGERPVNGPNLGDVLTVEPESPIDPVLMRALLRSIALDDTPAGVTVRSGVLTAAAPVGYVAQYIGTTARERARAARIAQLEAQLVELDRQWETTGRELRRRQDELAEAVEEQDAMPASTTWQHVHTQARTAQLAAQKAGRDAAERQMRADTELRSIQETLASAEQARNQALAALQSELDKTIALAEQAERAAIAAAEKASESTEFAEGAATRLEEATEGQARADDERQNFPPLAALEEALDEEDEATRQLTTAQAQAVSAAEQVRRAQGRTKQAFAALNRAVDIGDGRMLPAEPAGLKTFADSLMQLVEQLHSWKRATDRALDLCAHARVATAAATEQGERAKAWLQEAKAARATAVRQHAEVAKLRELYGAAYEELRLTHERSMESFGPAQTEVEQVRKKIQRAEIAAASASSTLASIAPQRELAEQHRERCLGQMNRLVDESVTTVDEDVTVDEAGRPANLTAALAWGARMLAAEPRAHNREELAKLLETRRNRLESEAKKVSAELTRFDRQVTLQTIPGTDWRRAIVAAPDALAGEDLHTTLLTLQQTAQQIEGDLRDDVKVTLKTSMFTALRRDIATRRAAAQELVRQIRATLGDVRTGVARVGVEVDWKVKNDPDAQRMIELVSALPSDETFEQMYDVLRQRLEEATGDTWEARVAHTFDYRVWHEWDIKVTHASFGDGTTEVFRPLTARSNPLASFSTGEMRLATMLPLLAAAWSMYEAPGYQGPRLLFIDEVNAAFDPQNVRKLLALLREWNFDVLSTAPEMSAMLKAESEQVMIAQVAHSGAVRVSMPWLWTGSGQPLLVADRIGNSAGQS